MNNLERRLRRLEEHHGAYSHRNDRGFLKLLVNPTEQDVEATKESWPSVLIAESTVAPRKSSSSCALTLMSPKLGRRFSLSPAPKNSQGSD
jgi:hypothetical protein